MLLGRVDIPSFVGRLGSGDGHARSPGPRLPESVNAVFAYLDRHPNPLSESRVPTVGSPHDQQARGGSISHAPQSALPYVGNADTPVPFHMPPMMPTHAGRRLPAERTHTTTAAHPQRQPPAPTSYSTMLSTRHIRAVPAHYRTMPAPCSPSGPGSPAILRNPGRRRVAAR
jgi:hypothetical protein